MLINNNHTQYTEYVQALEEERRKIQVFERELPLCLELVTQAIETCRQQMSGTTTECLRGQSECSEPTSSEGPILEEFIPIKRNFSFEDEGKKNQKEGLSISNNNNKKSDWLSSVQLWNQTPDPPIKEDSPRKMPVMEVKRNGGGAFHPFKKEKNVVTPAAPSPPVAAAAAASSSAETGGHSGGGSKGEDKGGESLRKSRRCWSPELHKRFLHALQQLGGCHVATPKQIRELMKVDGLTNDEVKSHLQKYRLHTRRPSLSIHNDNQQQPQFVVVGGIWVPPREYAAMATTASEEATMHSTPDGIYAPRATLPPSLPSPSASPNQNQQHNQFRSDERRNNSDAGVHCNSPASSSSTHTTTASPVF